MANNQLLWKLGIHSTTHLASALRELAWIFLFAALTPQSQKEFGKSRLNKKPTYLLWAVDIQAGHFHEHGRICIRSSGSHRARSSVSNAHFRGKSKRLTTPKSTSISIFAVTQIYPAIGPGRALDTGLPTPTPSYAFFTAKGRKKCLDMADAVIHGQSLPVLMLCAAFEPRRGLRSRL